MVLPSNWFLPAAGCFEGIRQNMAEERGRPTDRNVSFHEARMAVSRFAWCVWHVLSSLWGAPSISIASDHSIEPKSRPLRHLRWIRGRVRVRRRRRMVRPPRGSPRAPGSSIRCWAAASRVAPSRRSSENSGGPDRGILWWFWGWRVLVV